MNVGGVTANLSLLLNSSGASASGGVSAFLPAQNNTAKSAVSATILPSNGGVQLGAEALLALQGETKPPPAATSGDLSKAPVDGSRVEDRFLAEAHKSPMQRMREQILSSLGLTEDQLAQMSPEERQAVEQKIRDLIEEKLRQAHKGQDAPQSNADVLQSLL